jgi:MarR family transcriptional regulator, lower aerobic nicotinate degradation pathway regulator
MNVQTRTKRAAATRNDEEIVDLLREVHRTLRSRLMRGAEGTRRSLAALSVLSALGREPGVSLNQLARRQHMPKSLVSMIIGDLSADGLVRKTPDPRDQRLIRLRLTAAGDREVDRWRTAYRAIASDAVGSLTREDASHLLRGLRALRDATAAASGGDAT